MSCHSTQKDWPSYALGIQKNKQPETALKKDPQINRSATKK